ncbi:adenosylcobinamide-GDP ribazoletransferase [Phytoactinopolyspora alkaliphila]|uniref:Adenosylcobinamide-GDP ribazoletransferase n=1 Tax=Phytoactinopolyspora alkaliphila TaxID=1783498 RepID=A0A6N9YL16_9ACTN|nr:adenosylcobinamide-GDP ribazoletransferase [Phytoactinopolyspora alkaliphila]
MAVGTLTAVRVAAPVDLTRRVAGRAMLLAPIPGLILGVVAGGVWWTGSALGTGPFVAAVLAVAALRLGDRGFHLDGLADTADGLAASYDGERALAVMRTGDTGPAGAVAVVVVLLAQVTAAAELGRIVGGDGWADPGRITAAVGVAGCVVISRTMLAAGCVRGVPAARPDGLGAVVAGSVGRVAATTAVVLVTAAFAGGLALTGAPPGALPWWGAAVAAGAALLAAAVVLRRCVRRFGGVTGDVLGAVVEVSLAVGLVGLVVAGGR